MTKVARMAWAATVLCIPGIMALEAQSILVDVASDVGLDFLHQDGRSGQKFYVETTASGGGWLDYDGDGDLDIYLLNGSQTPGSQLSTVPRNGLFESRGGRLVNVAARAGVADTGYGMGMCVGDVDGDGELDFLVTNFGADRLYRSLGDGHFDEISEAAGVADERWSSSCAFGDLDGDGDLDLYVTHYLDFTYGNNPTCRGTKTDPRAYCMPSVFDGVTDSLFINRGDGHFVEAGAELGLAQSRDEKSLGVIFADLDDDGDLDIYVANDGALNRLYLNDGEGRFQDLGLISGSGLDAMGIPEAGMGVDVGDADGDGLFDLLVTHFAMETNTLYRRLPGSALQFDDVTATSGFGPASYRNISWGVQWLDFDLDGDLDFAVANGHMQEGVEKLEPELSYRQPNQLFENRGARFSPVHVPALQRAAVSRGLAAGDWNNDGRPDLLLTNTNEHPELLVNRLDRGHHWLGLRLVGPPENRFGIGARVTLTLGDRIQVQEVRSGSGFQSQRDLRLIFGLGDHSGPIRVEIHWPDGRRQSLGIAGTDRYYVATHGSI